VTGVALVGAAESDLGVTGRSILGLQTQAVTRALADAGLTLADVDGLATTGVSRFSAAQLAEYLGLHPSWTDSTFAGGSAFEMYVARAAQAIEAGQCSTVVVSFASNQRSARSRSLGGVVEDHTPEAQFETPYGPLYPISLYAMAAGQYLHRYKARRGSSSPRSPSPRGSGRCSTRRPTATAPGRCRSTTSSPPRCSRRR
jgi:acetyl-CoA acetyltransferase